MKKLLTILFVAGILTTFNSCKKEESKSDNNNNTGPSFTGNLQFKINDVQYDVTAKVKYLPNNRYRLYWEDNKVGAYKNIEIDMFNNANGDYTILKDPLQPTHGAFQVYLQDGSNTSIYIGEAGTIKLTSVLDDKWSGTFSGSGTETNSGNSFTITNGTFTNVPKE